MRTTTGSSPRGLYRFVSLLPLVWLASPMAAQQPPVAQHNFPTQGPQPGPVQVVRAFPNLRFTRPVLATTAPDGTDRLFVVEQDGRVRVFRNDEQVATAGTFLDLTGKVSRGGNEEGLLGLAFDPGYRTNGWFYVHYSATNPRRSIVARFRVSATDPDRADAASEYQLLVVDQPYSNHNGGMLAFGPDDLLYIGFGDGGSSGDPNGNGQNLGTLLGKILRIDPRRSQGALNYTIPSDNPFVGTSGARGEIWALGLRNPWRFSFDRQTGELWVGDVGQNTREEIDLVRRGGNYGWNVFEGTLPYRNPNNYPPSRFDIPVLDYDTGRGRCVIGGIVYRGAALSPLRGAYLYGDYSSGIVHAVVRQGGKVVSDTRIGTLTSIVSFGEDPQAEPILVSLSGTLHRLALSTPPKPFPRKLSETGLFQNLATLQPAPGVLPYDIRAPFWSDGASKRRWITWQGSPWSFHTHDAWSLPVGTVLVKHFEIPLIDGDPNSVRRLETRVLVREQEDWAGYTYRWTPDHKDALLLNERETEELVIHDPRSRTVRQQTWDHPSRTDCLQCHSTAAGRLLSVRTPQLNVEPRGANQLDQWNQAGLFGRDIGNSTGHPALTQPTDPKQPLGARARAWLDVNCSMCHLPGGSGRGSLDLRWTTPDDAIGAIDLRPQFGDLALPDAYLIKPRVHQSSVLWSRLARRDEAAMPRLGSNLVDTAGAALIAEWIGSPYRELGPGCSGAAGMPTQRPVDGAWARIGQTWEVELVSLPPGGAAVLWAGSSATRWGAATLPLDLAGIGMPGCALRVAMDVLLPLQRSGGTGRLVLQVPNDPSLAGIQVFTQAFASDPTANPKGIVASNGVAHEILRK